jgi:hypothetical protein
MEEYAWKQLLASDALVSAVRWAGQDSNLWHEG